MEPTRDTFVVDVNYVRSTIVLCTYCHMCDMDKSVKITGFAWLLA